MPGESTKESRPFVKRALEGGINFFGTANRCSLYSAAPRCHESQVLAALAPPISEITTQIEDARGSVGMIGFG
jgi:hypothetical protein